mgnify:CR=1 FL=1|tara:strand:+ start:2379 stop:2747 length:369 start_codon:yes stop_codon:yes gene_type:complete
MQALINMGFRPIGVERHNNTAPASATLECDIQGHPVKIESFTDYYGTPACRLQIEGLDLDCEWYHEPSSAWRRLKSQPNHSGDREKVNAWRLSKRKLPHGVVQYKFRNELGHLATFLLSLNN